MLRLPLAFLTLPLLAPLAVAQDVNEAYEKAMKAAVTKAAPWVAKIETSGGREVVGAGQAGVRKGVGPTTGVVVGSDGYVISSSFNFANSPTAIYVSVPGRERKLAKVVATDTTRMLTLLKVADLTDLPVAVAYPKKEIQVGQWSMALGRTLDPEIARFPSICAGIISATGRINGKAIQSDAKISPVNYGGPLVALDGRVFGVVVPASPRGEGDTAGVEWYDSGIGFAIPLEDVYKVLPKLKEGKDLRRGLLGIVAQNQTEQYNAPVVIGSLSPDGAAAKAGMKVGDRIATIDGIDIPHYMMLQRVLGPKYEGDVVAVKVSRDGKDQEFAGIVLTGVDTSYSQPFLGILPMRDDPDPGVEIRFVYPNSPAATAGLQVGDRIMKFGLPAGPPMPPMPRLGPNLGLPPVMNRVQLAGMVTRFPAGTEVQVEVKRKEGGKTETVTLKLGQLQDVVPAKLPMPSSAKRALERPKGGPPPKKEEPKNDEAKKDDEKKDDEKKEGELGLLKRSNETTGREYWLYVPENYDKNVSHGVIVWFHQAGKGGKDAEDLIKIWQDFCEEHHFLIVGPVSRNAAGWIASETEEVVQDLRTVVGQYTTDRSRVVAHGIGIGGQMSFYIGFAARDLIRGVAASGAVLSGQPKDNIPGQPLSFFLVAGDKDPLLKDIQDGKAKLTEKKFPLIYRELKEFGKEYLDEKTLNELRMWMDSLDRI